MFDVTELEGMAAVVAAVVGIVSLLTPILNRLAALRKLGFERHGVLNAVGEIASVGAFLLVLTNRQALDHWLPVPVWFVLTIIAALVLVTVAEKAQQPFSWQVVLLGGALYAFATGTFTLGLTKVSAEIAIFHPLQGEVRHDDGSDAAGTPVFLLGAEEGTLLETRTRGDGTFRFLLTSTEARNATQVVAGARTASGRNWEAVDWDPNSRGAFRVREALVVPSRLVEVP